MHTSTEPVPHTWVMPPLPFDESLSDALAQFRMWGLASGHSERTIVARESTIRRVAANCDVAEVTEAQLVAWLAGLEIRRSSKATYRSHLAAFFRWLRKTGRRIDDPAEDLPKPGVPRGVPHPTSPSGVTAVLAACSDPRARSTRAMVMLAAYAGLRVHEVAKVHGRDVDLDARQLWVEGKGGSRMSVPLHGALVELAQDMPADAWWFPSGSSVAGHVDRKSVGNAISRAYRRAGIEGHAHDLRHFFGTQVLRNTGNLRTTQRALRHASIATTERYTQVADEELFRAVAGIPAA